MFNFSNLKKEVLNTEKYLADQAKTPDKGVSNFMSEATRFISTAEKEIATGKEDITTIDSHIENLVKFKNKREDDLTMMQNFTDNVKKLFIKND